MKSYKLLSRVLPRGFAKTAMSGFTLFDPVKTPVSSSNSAIPMGQTEELVDFRLERHEIEARVYNVMHQFEKIDMRTFTPHTTFKQLNLDSLETIAVVVALEREFHTAFEENVFDGFESPKDVIDYLTTTPYAF